MDVINKLYVVQLIKTVTCYLPTSAKDNDENEQNHAKSETTSYQNHALLTISALQRQHMSQINTIQKRCRCT